MPWTRFVTICKLPFSSVREWRARNIKIDKIELHTFARRWRTTWSSSGVGGQRSWVRSIVRSANEVQNWTTEMQNMIYSYTKCTRANKPRYCITDHALPKNLRTDDSDPRKYSVRTMHNDVCRAISFLGCKWISQRSLNDACFLHSAAAAARNHFVWEKMAVFHSMLCALRARCILCETDSNRICKCDRKHRALSVINESHSPITRIKKEYKKINKLRHAVTQSANENGLKVFSSDR